MATYGNSSLCNYRDCNLCNFGMVGAMYRSMTTTKPKKLAPVPEYPKVVETFRKLAYFETRDWEQKEPSVWNGDVKIRKYRVTIEEISEPVEVLTDRLQALWDLSDNYHHSDPLMNAAKRLGYTLKGDRGSKVSK